MMTDETAKLLADAMNRLATAFERLPLSDSAGGAPSLFSPSQCKYQQFSGPAGPGGSVVYFANSCGADGRDGN